jgi:flagellar biosynthesis/type III secretory pathway protein FliH
MTGHSPFRELFDAGAESVGSLPGRATRSSAEARRERFCFPRLDDVPEAAAEQEKRPAGQSSEAELVEALAAARTEAAGETEARLRAELSASLEHRQAQVLRALCEQLGQARASFERLLEQRAGASRDLALALARALVPRALAHAPLVDIEAMLCETIARLERYPRLELRLPQELVAQGRSLLDRVAAETGYPGELAVSPDVTLGPGDARLCWHDGAAVRDLAELEAEARDLVDAWLPAGRLDDRHPTDSGPTKVVPLRPALSKGSEP